MSKIEKKRDYLFKRNISRINKWKQEAADLYSRDWNMSVMQMKSHSNSPLHWTPSKSICHEAVTCSELRKCFDIFFMNLASPVLR